MNIQEIIDKTKNLAIQQATDVLIVLNYKPETEPASVDKIKEFTNGIVADEKYYLYLLKYPMSKIAIETNVKSKKN